MNSHLLDIVASVCRRLQTEPYLVGGLVRDRLLGIESHDWDLVCRKAKSVARATARELSAHLVILDEQNRIYRVVLGGEILDFAELQGKTIQEDLARRDFTINAMASPLGSNRLIDPFGGQKDLKKKIIRAVSHKAFQEDPLRVLRAYRLSTQFGLRMEPKTRRWIAETNSKFRISNSRFKNRFAIRNSQSEIPAVSAERVREEFLRLLSQPHAAPALVAMDRGGLLTTLFPELEAGRRVARAYYGRGGVLKHQLESVAAVEWLLKHLEKERGRGFVPNAVVLGKVTAYCRQPVGGFQNAAFLKLGALLHDVGKPATAQVIRGRLRFFGHEDVGADLVGGLLERLRFSRRECQLVRAWVRNHMRLGNLACAPVVTSKAIARFFRDLGDDGAGMLIISLGDHFTYLAKSRWGQGKDPLEKTASRLLASYYLERESVVPPKIVDGHLLMKRLRLKPGPLVGKLLEAIRDGQAEGRVHTAAEGIAWAKKSIRKLKGKA